MATISIIDENNTTFVFDVVREYTLTSLVVVTDHPVETGATISDHAQKQPKLVAFRGIVSESPYDSQDTSGGPDRVSAALAFLDSIAGTLVQLVTEAFGTFPSMAITRYPTTRSQLMNLEFDCEFKEVTLATAGLVDIPPEAPATESAAAGSPDEQDTGEQGTTDAAESGSEAEAADKSLLLSITEALGIAP